MDAYVSIDTGTVPTLSTPVVIACWSAAWNFYKDAIKLHELWTLGYCALEWNQIKYSQIHFNPETWWNWSNQNRCLPSLRSFPGTTTCTFSPSWVPEYFFHGKAFGNLHAMWKLSHSGVTFCTHTSLILFPSLLSTTLVSLNHLGHQVVWQTIDKMRRGGKSAYIEGSSTSVRFSVCTNGIASACIANLMKWTQARKKLIVSALTLCPQSEIDLQNV